jgi:hypothetical protein
MLDFNPKEQSMNKHVALETAAQIRRQAYEEALHELALEGLTLDPEAALLAEKVISGEITGDDYLKIITSRTQ